MARVHVFLACLFFCFLFAWTCAAKGEANTVTVTNITLQFVSQPLNYSVINHTSPALQAIDPNNRGIECGQIVKVNNTYNLFVTELHSPACSTGEYWCNVTIAHWMANADDLSNWTRVIAIADGNQGCTPNGQIVHDNVLWSPFVHYMPDESQWYMTYVGYDTPCNNYPQNGNIVLSKLNRTGYQTILHANFTSLPVTLMDGNASQYWEGTKDVVDSFSNTYYISPQTAGQLNINSTMFAIYGSCCDHNATTPDAKWGVGLVYSASNTMYGPWIRYAANPLNWTGGVENPIVTVTKHGYYLATFCVNLQEALGCGFSWSMDGVHWTPTQVFAAGNVPYCRVPLALIEQDDATFLFFYTDFDVRHTTGNTSVWEGFEGLYISNFKLVVETNITRNDNN